MKTTLSLILILVCFTASAQLYSSKDSQMVLDSVMKAKPTLRIDSIGFYRSSAPSSALAAKLYPKEVYTYVYTFTYKQFDLIFEVPFDGSGYKLTCIKEGHLLLLQPHIQYALLERFQVPSKPQRK